ncbi:MAG: type II toxin-antitoxin system ParD family antitoxin [Acidobacteriota bacterium]
MNVSLPEAQERFVQTQVQSGRYQSATDVVRDALRLLEEAEHRRLVEKWLHEGLTDAELARLPDELKARARAHVQGLIDEGLQSAEDGGWLDGAQTIARLRAKFSSEPSAAT